jgi:hypothetical protein
MHSARADADLLKNLKKSRLPGGARGLYEILLSVLQPQMPHSWSQGYQ